MNPKRKRRLIHILMIGTVITTAMALVLYALGQNISLFYTPAQVASGHAPENKQIRVGGMVEKGSIIRDKKTLNVSFRVTDFKESLVIHYQGILPDLFREEQGIVALGKIDGKNHFIAEEILAKHDENYMPPEVRDSLPKDVLAKMIKS